MKRSRALALTVRALDAVGIDHALVGAFAVGLHGAPRTTGDLDLLACDRRLFERATWRPVVRARLGIEIRIGDDDDDLAGVVRIAPRALFPIDVVMPKGRWVTGVIERTRAAGRRIAIAGTELALVELADLVLTKLYAGGAGDHRDIIDVLAVSPELDAVIEAVDVRAREQPERCAAAWLGLRAEVRPERR